MREQNHNSNCDPHILALLSRCWQLGPCRLLPPSAGEPLLLLFDPLGKLSATLAPFIQSGQFRSIRLLTLDALHGYLKKHPQSFVAIWVDELWADDVYRFLIRTKSMQSSARVAIVLPPYLKQLAPLYWHQGAVYVAVGTAMARHIGEVALRHFDQLTKRHSS